MYFNDACEPARVRRRFLIKPLLIVKITAIILLVFSLQVSASGFTQTVTLSFKNAPVKKVFKEIIRQTGVSIIYSDKMFDRFSPVHIDVKNATVEEVLDQCFRNQPVVYKIENNAITIKRADPVGSSYTAFPADAELPPVEVQGKVTSQEGAPLSDVSIIIKGTTTGVTSDENGVFKITVPDEKAVLVLSYIGFQTQEIAIGKRTSISVSLVVQDNKIEDVVVVGYGSQSKRNLATATSRVAAADIKNAVITTVDQALQGRTTGVQVVETSGEPGAATVVRIRGNNSLSGNNEPLYVIDGFPMPTYREAGANFYGSYTQNGLYGINPNDIESMEVLKDASATAIYGSRGANGVVLITTKAGKRGDGRIELVNKTSVGAIANPWKMMNSRQYAESLNEAYVLGDYDIPFPNMDTSFATTDWVDLITQNSLRQDVTLSVSGGTQKSSYYISGNYLFEKGTILNSDNGRGSIRANLNNEVTKWYTIKGQISLVRQKANRAITTSKAWPYSGGLMDGLKAPPTIQEDYIGDNSMGIPGFSSWFFANPLNELTSKTDVSMNDYSILNIENWFTLSSDLKLVVSLGGNQNLTRRKVFMPATTADGFGLNGKSSNTMANTYSYNVNAYLSYDKNLNENHKLNLTLGGEYNSQIVEFLNTNGSGYDVPYFGVDNIGTARTANIGNYKEERILQSGFFRGNYSYKGKYILNTSVRLDGASPFAENKKYGLFPAVAVAWNMDEENFMSGIDFVSNTKLRASFGETGSQAIGPYSSLPRYGSSFYQIGGSGGTASTLFPTSLSNPDLSWERTRQFNAGLDFNLFNSRLMVTFDYYNKTTIDLLQQRVLPTQAGFGSIIDNYGTMRNKGVELGLQTDIIRNQHLRLTTRLNISHNKTTLVNLGEKTTPDYVSLGGNLVGGVSGILIPGQEVGLFFGHKVTGLTQEADFDENKVPSYPYPVGGLGSQIPGSWRYEDVDGNKSIDADDRQIIGKSMPDFTFGWSNDLTWKNLGINLFFTGSIGNDLLNLTRFYLQNGYINYYGVVFNQTEEWYNNRWQPTRPHNDPRYPGTQLNINGGDINSVMVEDGSYFRLKQATVSYTFPSFTVLKNPRLFVTGTNVFTITKYTGFDPEVSSFNQSLLQQGIDYGAYPAQRSFTIGFSCNF